MSTTTDIMSALLGDYCEQEVVAPSLDPVIVPAIPTIAFVPEEIELDVDITLTPIELADPPAAPELGDDFPDAPTLQSLNPVEIAISLDWPTLAAEVPSLDFSGQPGELTATAPGDPPAITEPEIPDAPVYDLPATPTISEVTIPTMDDLTIPEFAAELDLQSLSGDSISFDFTYTPYDSPIFVALSDKVLAKLAAGGSGLDETVEAAMYERDLYRQQLSNEKAYNDITRVWESRGFYLPSGPAAGLFADALFERARNEGEASRAIMVKQAELAQANDQFIVKTSLELETVLRDFFIKDTANQLQIAAETVRSKVEVLNAQIAINNAAIAAFNAQVQVYNTQVQAALAKIEIFKAKMEGARIEGELQKLNVELYTSLLQGVLAQIEVYKGRLQGAQIAMEIQKTRLDLHGKVIEAYIANVQAWATQWQAYKTKTEGQIALVQAYGAQVDAYKSQVEAVKTRAEAEIMEKQLEMEENKVILQMNTALLQEYDTKAKIVLGKLELDTKVYDGRITSYRAQIDGALARYDAEYKYNALHIELAKTNAALLADVQQLKLQSALGQVQIEGELEKTRVSGQATVYAALAGQYHMSNSISRSCSRSRSSSNSNSDSTSNSTSTSTSVSTSQVDQTIAQNCC